MVHEHYQIEITIHPQLFPFTLAPTINFAATNHPIPYLNWEAKRQKGPMFSVMYWLIAIASSLYPHNRVKRLYPERVLACSLYFTRNEGRVHVNCSSSHRKCVSKNSCFCTVGHWCNPASQCDPTDSQFTHMDLKYSAPSFFAWAYWMGTLLSSAIGFSSIFLMYFYVVELVGMLLVLWGI